MSLSTSVLSTTEGILIAVDALRANKVRAALTILGVAIGVFVVVVMSAAIHGINSSVAEEFEAAGPTTFYIRRFPISLGPCEDAESCPWRNNPPVRFDEALAIGGLSTVQEVMVRTATSAPVKYRSRALSSVTMRAYTANWLEVESGDVSPGRSFTGAENTSGARVAVVNTILAERLFGDVDPIGRTVQIGGAPYEVIGVYHPPRFNETDRPFGIVPLETARRHLNVSEEWLEISVKPREVVARDEAIDDVTAFLRGQRGLRPGAENNFAIVTQDELFETWERVTGIFFLVMLALSGIGLLVGGVGVVAIMMISVTERTREIGVRKALGATRRTILWQFLVEAATLTAVGAIFGLAFGWLVALAIRSASPVQAEIPPVAIIAAMIASCLTGILFGLYPAAKAARLDPIDALRYE